MARGDKEEQDLLKISMQSLETAVAIADAADWAVAFENARFFQLFPPDPAGSDALATRIPGFDADLAAKRLGKGRTYSFEVETKSGPRTVSLKVNLRPLEGEADGRVLVECLDISKQKETEYMLDSYSRMSEKNAREVQREKDRVEKLLLNIMPKSVYEELKDFGTTTPQRFDAVSVLMLDFVGFTDMAISQDPGAVVAELNDIFSAFDRIVELFDCERIKTIGDAYVAVSGLPEENPDNAKNIAKVALRMRRYLEKRNASHPQDWHARIGIATGPLIGSIVGIQKYVYDIFGPAANLAARLEEFCEPMQITLTEATQEAIRDEFSCRGLGTFEIKGFGEIPLYQLEYERARRS